MSKFWYPVPVYVTRKDADGETGSFTIAAGYGITVFILVVLNIALWSGYGLYEWGVNIFG